MLGLQVPACVPREASWPERRVLKGIFRAGS
jgi:hypothetical protein